jgi:hypothetical protein
MKEGTMPDDSQKIELSALQQLQVVLQALADMQAPSVAALLSRSGYQYEADVVKTIVEAFSVFPWDQVVTFAPLPERKPDGGFLEVGEFDGDTYAWENSVKLLLGSNGKVYAEVVECVTELPDLDDEGRPLHGRVEDNHSLFNGYFMTDQPPTCPQCGARTEFTEATDRCSGCGAVVQSHTCLDCGYKFFVHASEESAEEDALAAPVASDQAGA